MTTTNEWRDRASLSTNTGTEALRQRVKELDSLCKFNEKSMDSMVNIIDTQAEQIKVLESERDKLIIAVADHVTVRSDQFEQIKVARDALGRIRTGDWIPDWVRKLAKEAIAKLEVGS